MTTANAFDRLSEAFAAAMAAQEAGVVIDDLTKLCHGDKKLAEELRSLLNHHSRAGDEQKQDTDAAHGFLDVDELRNHHIPAITGPISLGEWGASSIGQQVGEYTLISQLGSGGMAVVFVAEQDKPRRKVALKLVRRNVSNDQLYRRFAREAELHGCLSHPGIAQVYDAGVAKVIDDGGQSIDVPFLAMELVQGPNIADFANAFGNDPPTVLRLIAEICDAVQHAHQRGVIHRDLKPANILVTGGARGEATIKVLDFGVARGNADEGPEAVTRLTQHGYVLGTLAYMSPEQLGASCDVDTRGDVYAIGVMLFELLAGRQPINLAGCGLAEAAVRIAEAIPLRLGTINRDFRGDIETIVAKALEKDPDRRYQSPAELADDLRHYLAGEPIQARRDSLVYTLSRRMARYRNITVAAILMMLAGIVTAFYVHHQQTLQLRASNAEADALRREQVSLRRADTLAGKLAQQLSSSRISEGRLLSASGAWIDAERLLWDEYLAHPDSLDARWALRELYTRSGCRLTIDTLNHKSMALADSGRGLFATAGDVNGQTTGIVRLWRSDDGRPAGQIDSKLGAVHGAAFVERSYTILLVGSGGACLASTTGSYIRQISDKPAAAVAASESLLAVGHDDGVIRIFTPAGKPLTQIRSATSGVRAVAISSGQTHLAALHADGSIRLWRIKLVDDVPGFTPGPPLSGHGSDGRSISFSPDGRSLVSGAGDQMIRLWRTEDGAPLAALRTKNGTARDVTFSQDGRQLAVAGYWRTQIFDVSPRTPYLTPTHAIDGESVACQFSPDGRSLLTLATEGICRVWDLQPSAPTVLRGQTAASVNDLLVSKMDGRPVLIAAQGDGNVTVRTPSAIPGTWDTLAEWSMRQEPRGMAFDATGKQLWIGSDTGHVMAYDPMTGRILASLPMGAAVRTVSLTPDSRTLIAGLADGRVTFWEADGQRWKKTFEERRGTDVRGAAISQDGKTLVTTHRFAILRTWSISERRLLGEIVRPTAAYGPAFTPDGRRLAAGEWGRNVHVWKTSSIHESGQPQLTLIGHGQLVSDVAFDDTGSLLASVSTDGQWRLWDATDLKGVNETAERRCLTCFDPSPAEAVAIRFLPTEAGRSKIAVGYRDGSVRIWDLNAGDHFLAGNRDYQISLRTTATTRP